MFGISLGEILLILVIALIIFGPEQLPVIATSIGSLLAKLRNMSNDLRGYARQNSGLDELDKLKTQLKNQLNINYQPDSSEFNEIGFDKTQFSNLDSIYETDIYDELPIESYQQAELDFDRQPELFDKQ